MKDLDMIIEEIVETLANLDFVEKFYSDLEISRLEKDVYYLSRFKYAHLVYVDNSEKLPVIVAFHSCPPGMAPPPLGRKRSFVDALEKYKPSTFQDFLLFIQLYINDLFYCGNFYIKGLSTFYPIPKTMKRHPVVDEILSETHGIIAWHYQLEILVRLFSKQVSTAIKEIAPRYGDWIAKIPNNKDEIKAFADILEILTGEAESAIAYSAMELPLVWEKTKYFMLNKSLSLFDVLYERILLYGLGRVEIPRVDMAYNLFKTVKA